MRAEFLRGKRKEESETRGKRKEEFNTRGKIKEVSKTRGKRKGEFNAREKRKEELGLRGIIQRKGQLGARKEDEVNQDRELKQATRKETKRKQGASNQENHNKRKRDDLHYPWQPAIFASESNPKWNHWDFYGSLPANSRNNYLGNLKSCGGLSRTSVLVPPASLHPPQSTPSLTPPPKPTPSSASPPSPPKNPYFAEHTPRRLSVITSTSDVRQWNEVRLVCF